MLRGYDESNDLEPPPLPPIPDDTSGPRPPSQDAPSGFVWPPVEGRIVLREAAMTPLSVRVGTNGDCIATAEGWSMRSASNAIFDDVEAARSHLVRWARKHATAQDLLSRRRCIVLAETGDGQWRLWQVVRADASPHAAFIAGPSFAPAPGLVRRVDERANSARLEVETRERAFLVMSVTPHKYWRITIDGADAPAVVTNIGYQGVVIPTAGRHVVEMRYRNPLIAVGAAITVIALLALIAIARR